MRRERPSAERAAALGCGAMSRALGVIYLPPWAARKTWRADDGTDGLLDNPGSSSCGPRAKRPLLAETGLARVPNGYSFPVCGGCPAGGPAKARPGLTTSGTAPQRLTPALKGPPLQKQVDVRKHKNPSWRLPSATHSLSAAPQPMAMSSPCLGHVASSMSRRRVPHGVRDIHVLRRLRVLRRRRRARHIVCHRRGAENSGSYGADGIAAHHVLLCADPDGVPSHRRRIDSPTKCNRGGGADGRKYCKNGESIFIGT